MSKVSLPRLAEGGIATASTIVNVGEAGKEAIVPLERNTSWMNDLASKVAVQSDSMSNRDTNTILNNIYALLTNMELSPEVNVTDVIDAIKNDRKPYVDAIAGRNAVEMILAIYKSQKTGEPVKLPLTNFKSLDMVGEF